MHLHGEILTSYVGSLSVCTCSPNLELLKKRSILIERSWGSWSIDGTVTALASSLPEVQKHILQIGKFTIKQDS